MVGVERHTELQHGAAPPRPSPPPDLDCGEIAFTNYTVLPPEPHRFDRDKDAVGCER